MRNTPRAQFKMLENMDLVEEWTEERQKYIDGKNGMLGHDHYKLYDCMQGDLTANCIDRGFSWSNSKQGYEYWEKKSLMYSHLRRGYSIQAMTDETVRGKRK